MSADEQAPPVDWGEQLAEASAFVLDDIKQKWKQMNGGPSVLDSLKEFAAAVDWSEKWIIGLVAVQAVLFLCAIFLRRNTALQATIFFTATAVVFCAERLNSLGGQHWRSFARQPYFDPHGIFTSTLLSAPLLLTMFVILINYLVAASQLLIQMKRKELMYKARERHRQEQGDGGGADTKKKK